MPNTILWLDSKNAKIFNLDEGKLTTRQLHPHDPDHHTHSKNEGENESSRFFKTIGEEIKNKKHILILGPGLAKKHFSAYLKTHYPSVHENLLALVTIDHPTTAQIIEYFKIM